MGDPTFKIFNFKQRYLKYILQDIAKYVIKQKSRVTDYYPKDIKPVVIFPELTTKDTSVFALSLQQIIIASVQSKLLDKKTAFELIAAISTKLGVEIDATSVMGALGKEAEDDVYQE